MNRLAAYLVITSLAFAAPRLANAANITTTFDTVDVVEINTDNSNSTVVVTGILKNGSVVTTLVFTFGTNSDSRNVDMAARCERLAVIAMSKPGKFQFAIGSNPFSNAAGGGCRLILRTP